MTHYCLYFHIFFFFNDPATTEIYTLSLHDALPIWMTCATARVQRQLQHAQLFRRHRHLVPAKERSEEHTSELQSQFHLVCRLLLEKKNCFRPNSSSPSSTVHRVFIPPSIRLCLTSS